MDSDGNGDRTSAFWLDRPTFVTGATGLLGGWLVRSLVRAGADVTCLVRDWVPKSELVRTHLVEHVHVVRGDVRDQALLERTLGEYQIDTVFHLAAQSIVGTANRNPISTFETNIQGTWALLEACRRSPATKQIVVASSDKAYGEHDVLPYLESAPLRGRHPYDVSKSCADLLAQSYAFTFQLPVAITRCGNLYGGGDLNWNRLIPGTIRSILRHQQPVIRSDGQFIRDYFFVEDAVSAYLLLGEQLAHRAALRGQAFNFSNESPATALQVVACLVELMHTDLEPQILNEANNEIRAQYLDASNARQLLNWKASYNLAEGLKATVRWYEDFLGTKIHDN
jgi:CDP-glucose 4,6-dehydratase